MRTREGGSHCCPAHHHFLLCFLHLSLHHLHDHCVQIHLIAALPSCETVTCLHLHCVSVCVMRLFQPRLSSITVSRTTQQLKEEDLARNPRLGKICFHFLDNGELAERCDRDKAMPRLLFPALQSSKRCCRSFSWLSW